MSLVLTKKENTIGATILVAGCCIGAGMLGLPVLSLASGFIPSTMAILFSYLFTTATGLLLLEATLWFEEKTNLLSISSFALGRFGKIITGILFIFLFYSIFVAYMDGGGRLFSNILEALFKVQFSRSIGILSCIGFVGLIIYSGIEITSKINQFLMSALLVTYFAMVFISVPYVETQNLSHVSWRNSLSTLPILFICFGFQNLIPSLTYYLNQNVRHIRFAIIIGNSIPLLFYVIWNFIVLGITSSIRLEKASIVTDILKETTQVNSIIFLSEAFSFFSLTTSFIAVGISFIDFFRDALKSFKKANSHQILIFFLVFIPPLIFSLFYSDLFLRALEFAGGVIDVILFGVLPVLIVWSGRYIKKVKGIYRLKGGKGFLICMMGVCFSLLLLRVLI